MCEHRSAIALFLVCALVSCDRADRQAEPEQQQEMIDEAAAPGDSTAIMGGVDHAVAELWPTAGNGASGNVTFTFDQNFPGADVEARLVGLSPGQHGFHIHEFGDCSALDASSAGGHFAPHGSPHGSPDNEAGERHLGDLGNLDSDADSVAVYSRHDDFLTFTGVDSIVGRAVVVHEGPDDFLTQPDGGGGSRIACGVIEAGDMPAH